MTPQFVLDVHLGALARHLRLLGFDARYDNAADDPELARIAAEEARVLLSRDRELLRRRAVTDGYLVRADDPDEQVVEVVRVFRLCENLEPFTRCLSCNAIPEPVPKSAVLERLEPKTRRYYDEFRLCPGCERIYWRGSHVRRLEQLVERVRRDACSDQPPGPGSVHPDM